MSFDMDLARDLASGVGYAPHEIANGYMAALDEIERLTEDLTRLTERNAVNQILRDEARDEVARIRARIRAVIDDE